MSVYCKTIYTENKGSCFYNLDFPIKKFNSQNFYFLPELNIYIDEISYRMLKESSDKFFFSIPIPGYSQDIRSLKPLTKEQHKEFQRKKDKIKYEYDPPKTLGEGTFGKVIGYDVMKSVVKLSKEEKLGEHLPGDTVKEIAFYRYFKNINDLCIPRFQGFSLFPKIELQISKGLRTLTDSIPTLDDYTALQIMLKLAKCMSIVASQKIVNLDLKPHNMIMATSNQVQIIDWGLAEVVLGKDQSKYEKQTLWWRSPEVCLNQPYNYKADIFSLGIIFIQLYTKNYDPICPTNDIYEYMRCLLRTLVNFNRKDIDTPLKIKNKMESIISGPSHAEITKKLMLSGDHYPNILTVKGKKFSEDFADLASKMLELNPENRIDYDEIILHPIFQYLKRESIPRLPVFVNNMPNIPIYDYENRALIFKKLVDLADKDGLDIGAIFLAYQLYDLVMHKERKMANQYNDCGVTCLLIASKILNTDNDMVFNTATRIRYTSYSNILKLEKEIINILEGNLLIPSLYTYKYGDEIMKNLRIALGYYNRIDVYKTPFKEVDLSKYFLINVKASYGISVRDSEFTEYNKNYLKSNVAYLDVKYKMGDKTKVNGMLNSVPILEVI